MDLPIDLKMDFGALKDIYSRFPIGLLSAFLTVGCAHPLPNPTLKPTLNSSGVILSFVGGGGSNRLVESGSPNMTNPKTLADGLPNQGTHEVKLPLWGAPEYFKFVSSETGSSSIACGINHGTTNPYAQNSMETLCYDYTAYKEGTAPELFGKATLVVIGAHNLRGASVMAEDLKKYGYLSQQYETHYESNSPKFDDALKSQLVYLPITSATNASPVVVSYGIPEDRLENGAQCKILGVIGNTAANGTFWMHSEHQPNGTVELFTDSKLTSPLSGNGDYSEGGLLFPISVYGIDNGYEVWCDSAEYRAAAFAELKEIENSSITGIWVDNGWVDNCTSNQINGNKFGTPTYGLTNVQSYFNLVIEESCRLHEANPKAPMALNHGNSRDQIGESRGSARTYFGLYPGDYLDYQVTEGFIFNAGVRTSIPLTKIVALINSFDVDAAKQRAPMTGLEYPGNRTDAITSAACWWLGDLAYGLNMGSGGSPTSNKFSNFPELMNLRHGMPVKMNTGASEIGSTGVWYRKYANGDLALVNTNSNPVTVPLPSGTKRVELSDLANSVKVQGSTVKLAAQQGNLYLASQ